MNFRDELLDECPLEGSKEIIETIEVFRTIPSNPPTEEDFKTTRQLSPDRPFKNLQEECRLRGISVWIDQDIVINLSKTRQT